jgi:hypothetical protein
MFSFDKSLTSSSRWLKRMSRKLSITARNFTGSKEDESDRKPEMSRAYLSSPAWMRWCDSGSASRDRDEAMSARAPRKDEIETPEGTDACHRTLLPYAWQGWGTAKPMRRSRVRDQSKRKGGLAGGREAQSTHHLRHRREEGARISSGPDERIVSNNPPFSLRSCKIVKGETVSRCANGGERGVENSRVVELQLSIELLAHAQERAQVHTVLLERSIGESVDGLEPDRQGLKE